MPEVRNLSLVKHQHITGQICKGAEDFWMPIHFLKSVSYVFSLVNM